MLTAAAEFLDAIASHNHTARRDAEYALARVDATVAAVTGSQRPWRNGFHSNFMKPPRHGSVSSGAPT